jgi:rhamnogalacturonyl hydrolase YesR
VERTLESFYKLKAYCEKEQFKGWDPYDGLNSKIFQATPLKKWDLARLAWIQFFKRSPFNLRALLLVPKEYNAKGLGLLLTGYCNLYNLEKEKPSGNFELEDLTKHITFLADTLVDLKVQGYSGSCWGYNFDWQARRLFLFPKYTPNVVTTYFVMYALLQAFEITKEKKYLEVALSSADFVINDLNRTEKKDGFLFSYSPLSGNNTVYNASLLGSKILSHCYAYTKDEKYKQFAKESIKACISGQKPDGSWPYGELPVQQWVDSFHTGYNLDALITYQELCGDSLYADNIERGFYYYITNFFLPDGTPKYYNNKIYPVDIHCPAQLFVTLARLNKYDENKELLGQVMQWTIDNMQNKKGYFYYQLKKGISSKIPYMRWSNAFMFYAMSYYLNEVS